MVSGSSEKTLVAFRPSSGLLGCIGIVSFRFSICLLAAAAPCVRDIPAVQPPSIYCLRCRSVGAIDKGPL